MFKRQAKPTVAQSPPLTALPGPRYTPMKITPSRYAIQSRMDRDKPPMTFDQMFPVAPPPPGAPAGLQIAMDSNLTMIWGYANQGYFG
jgi:hypothetical protein